MNGIMHLVMFDPMGWMTDAMTGGMTDLFKLIVKGLFRSMFGVFDKELYKASGLISAHPDAWNPAMAAFMGTINNMVILPVGVAIIAYVIAFEIGEIMVSQNNMEDNITDQVLQTVFKSVLALLILINSYDIIMGIFGLTSELIVNTAGVVGVFKEQNAMTTMAQFEASLETADLADIFAMFLLMIVAQIIFWVMTLMVWCIVYARLLEIYLYSAMAAIPLSTVFSRKFADVATGYIKNVVALGLQGVIMTICLAMYNILMTTIVVTDIVTGVIRFLAFGILIAFMLFRARDIAKGILGMR